MHPLIETEQLRFGNLPRYPDLCIPENTVTFISGPSGCGKSTLFKLLNGTLSPSEGCVRYRGAALTTLDQISLRRELLLVRQVPFLFRGSIAENFQRFHDMRESACPKLPAISAYLNLCHLPVSCDTRCDILSGGERQRVFLGIALSMQPKVLLLDEPTSALNQELSVHVMQSIVSYVKMHAITLIVISHDRELESVFAENRIQLESAA